MRDYISQVLVNAAMRVSPGDRWICIHGEPEEIRMVQRHLIKLQEERK